MPTVLNIQYTMALKTPVF